MRTVLSTTAQLNLITTLTLGLSSLIGPSAFGATTYWNQAATASVSVQVPNTTTSVPVRDYFITCDKGLAAGCVIGSVAATAATSLTTAGQTPGVELLMSISASTANNGIYDATLLVDAPIARGSNSVIGDYVLLTPFTYTSTPLKISIRARSVTQGGSFAVLRIDNINFKFGSTSNTGEAQDAPTAPVITMATSPVAGGYSLVMDAKTRGSVGQVAMNSVEVKRFVAKSYRTSLTVDAYGQIGKTRTLVETRNISPGDNFNYAAIANPYKFVYPTAGEFVTEFTVQDLAGKESAVTTGPKVRFNTYSAPAIVGTSCSALSSTPSAITVSYKAPQTTTTGAAITPSSYMGVTYYLVNPTNTSVVYSAGSVNAWTDSSVTKTVQIPAGLAVGSYKVRVCGVDSNYVEGDCALSQTVVSTAYLAGPYGPLQYICQVQ